MLNGGALYPAAMHNINATLPATMPALHESGPSNSQESYISLASSTFSAPQLPSSSSNLSTCTAGESEATTPPSSKVPSVNKQSTERAIPASPTRIRAQDGPLKATDANALRTDASATSPTSLTSPTAQGLKRAADGSVKGSHQSKKSPIEPTIGHKRNKSMEAGSSGRIGQLSAQLKTRLSYAMVKVQNGWEKQSLEELEEQTSQHGSPLSMTSRSNGSRLTFDSPTSVERRRRPSGVSENSDQFLTSPDQRTPSDPSRSLATTPSSLWRPGPKPALNAAMNLISITGSNNGPMLGPAADLGPRRKRRSSASFQPPPLLGSGQRKHYSDLGGGSRTPATPRPGILRMPSQQAEKDAVDTLLFMSSPNNSGRVPHTGMDAQIQRANIPLPQRRVMFETHPAGEKAVDRVHSQVPSNQSAAYYRAEPSR